MGNRYRIILFLCLSFFTGLFGADRVRDYLLTGGWYPHSKNELTALLDGYFEKAGKTAIPGTVRGIVAPHAGYAYSGLCAARAYKQLQGQKAAVSRVIVLGSSHHSGFYGACVSDYSHNSTPLGKIEVDRMVVDRLRRNPGFRTDNRIMRFEHSIENQLPFLQKVLKDHHFKIVPILFGRLDREDFPRLAAVIGRFVDSGTVVVASSDLNHYGRNFNYTPFIADIKENLTRLDKGMIETMVDLDTGAYFDYKASTGITMCGFVPVGILLHIFPAGTHDARLMDYSRSGDRNQDYTLSVSYASVVIWGKKAGSGGGGSTPENPDPELTEQEKKILLAMARKTLEYHFQDMDYRDAVADKYSLNGSLKQEAGVFVTLKKRERLRGCIGSIVGRKPLYQGVIDNAIHAALNDPRFPPLQEDELPDLKIEISVMTPLQKIADYKKIRLGIDGVIIKRGSFQAVYLPQVATETGWNRDEFLSHLCQKAGLSPSAYRSGTAEF